MNATAIFATGEPPSDARIAAAVQAGACWVAERLAGPCAGVVVIVEPLLDGGFQVSTCRPTRAQRRRDGLRAVDDGVLLVVDLGGDGFYTLPLHWRPVVRGGAA